jgi:hypothetical protein
MFHNTELRVKLLNEIYEYYISTNGSGKPVELDSPRGKLTLAYHYLHKRNLIHLSVNSDLNSGTANISPEGIDFIMKSKLQHASA